MTVIITCGESKQSLSAVRALGRAQIAVAVGAKRRPALGMWSRYATSTFLTEDAGKKPLCFTECLADELRGRYALCALSSRDDAWWALSRYRELLPASARRILPPHYSVVRSLDLEALYHFAESLGVACARLTPIPEGADAEVLTSLGLSFPLYIRPSAALTERDDSPFQHARLVAGNFSEFIRLIKAHPWLKNGFSVSDYTAIRSVSYFGVAEKGQVLVEGFQERLNELAPYSEISTLAVTIHPMPSVKKRAMKLLSALQWQGPFKIDFIKDIRGNYRLVTLIGRLWGSLELAIKAGVNIPLICYRLAEGSLDKDVLQNAKPDVRLRWVLSDIMAKVNHPATLLSKSSRFFKNLTFGHKHVRDYYDFLDLDDPMPFLYELQNKTWKRALSDSSE